MHVYTNMETLIKIYKEYIRLDYNQVPGLLLTSSYTYEYQIRDDILGSQFKCVQHKKHDRLKVSQKLDSSNKKVYCCNLAMSTHTYTNMERPIKAYQRFIHEHREKICIVIALYSTQLVHITPTLGLTAYSWYQARFQLFLHFILIFTNSM